MPIWGAPPQTTITQKNTFDQAQILALDGTPLPIFDGSGIGAPFILIAAGYYYNKGVTTGHFDPSEKFYVIGESTGTVFFETTTPGVLATPATGYQMFPPAASFFTGAPTGVQEAFFSLSRDGNPLIGTGLGTMTFWATAAIGI